MAKKAKQDKKETYAPEDLKRALGVAAGLEASFSDPPPPAAMAPAPLLDEITEMGEAGITGMLEHLASTEPKGRIPTLRAFRELGNAEAVPGLLKHARSLRWSPQELFALRETIHELDPKAKLPPELEGDAIARTRKVAELLENDAPLSPESVTEAARVMESLPPRLQEMAFRNAFLGEETEELRRATTAKMLQLAKAWEQGGAPPPAGLIDALASMETLEAAEVLSELAEAVQDKETGSRIRKALYRLKGKGIVIEKEDSDDSTAPAGVVTQGVDFVRAVVSATDGAGSCLVWIARSRQPRGRSLFQARLRKGRGIEEFVATDISSKELRDFFKRLSDESRLSTAEVPTGYAFWLLQQGQKENEGGGVPLPSGFTHSRLLLAPLADLKLFPPDGSHPARREVQPYAAGETRVEAKEMLAHTAFWTWVLEEERTAPYFNKCVEAFQSQVAVDDIQRRQLFDNAIEESAKEIYQDEVLRRRLSEQLESNAYLLNRLGQAKLAREAITLADEIGSGEVQPEFFTEVVRYSIGVMLERAIRQSQETHGHSHDHAHHDHDHDHDHEHEHGEGGPEGESSAIITP